MVRGEFNRTARRSGSSPTTLTPDHQRLRVVASRSHLGEREQQIVARLSECFEEIEMVSMGSSLKFCLLAEGELISSSTGANQRVGYRCGPRSPEGGGGDVVTADFCRCATIRRRNCSTRISWP